MTRGEGFAVSIAVEAGERSPPCSTRERVRRRSTHSAHNGFRNFPSAQLGRPLPPSHRDLATFIGIGNALPYRPRN